MSSNRIDDLFARTHSDARSALLPYLCAGDPDAATTVRLLLALERAGADGIELGVPFSDPLADGPTIQAASQRALRAGMTLPGVLAVLREARLRGLRVPVTLMSYWNPILALGIDAFRDGVLRAGADGVLVPDLPWEEAEPLRGPLAAAGVHLVLLAAPNTPRERLRLLGQRTNGFLYCVSLAGVTGGRSSLAAGLQERLHALREQVSVPLCVGFGISDAAQVRALAGHADGVIVGSALVDRIARAPSADDAVAEAGRFVAELRAALDPPDPRTLPDPRTPAGNPPSP